MTLLVEDEFSMTVGPLTVIPDYLTAPIRLSDPLKQRYIPLTPEHMFYIIQV
jgi:hypothetical protein